MPWLDVSTRRVWPRLLAIMTINLHDYIVLDWLVSGSCRRTETSCMEGHGTNQNNEVGSENGTQCGVTCLWCHVEAELSRGSADWSKKPAAAYAVATWHDLFVSRCS